MEKVKQILAAISFAKNMISFNEDALDSMYRIFFNWNQLFGKEDDWGDPDYTFLFYCIDFFDETLESVSEPEPKPLSNEEKMELFHKKGKPDVIETGKNLLFRLEKLLEEALIMEH